MALGVEFLEASSAGNPNKKDYFRLSFTGLLATEDLKTAIRILREHSNYEFAPRSLWDFRCADVSDSRKLRIENYSKYSKTFPPLPKTRIALLIGNTLQLGLSRQNMGFHGKQQAQNIFLSETDALSWLFA